MPDVGEGVAEAEIVEWSVKVGDVVREDQVVAAVMTDKATVEIPTPVAGTVLALGGGVGDVLAVGSELIRIDAPGLPDSPPPASRERAPRSLRRLPRRRRSRRGRRPRRPRSMRRRAPRRRRRPSPRRRRARASAQPARRVPRANGRSPRRRCGRGRAKRASICASCAARGPRGASPTMISKPIIARPPEAPAKRAGKEPNLAVETIKVVGMRRRIAQNMAKSSRRVAHFSYVEEVDVTALEELRASLNARATEERPKLTMLPFLMLAIVKAVADFPQVNAHYDDDNDVITRFGAVHLGDCDPDAGRADGPGGAPRGDAQPA